MSTVATINIKEPAVILPLKDYERLLARIEDLEDALAWQEAKAKTTQLSLRQRTGGAELPVRRPAENQGQ